MHRTTAETERAAATHACALKQMYIHRIHIISLVVTATATATATLTGIAAASAIALGVPARGA
eukprot:6201571-Pleurochrysis_carterae.AAC.6